MIFTLVLPLEVKQTQAGAYVYGQLEAAAVESTGMCLFAFPIRL